MNTINISDLVKAISLVIGLSMSAGKFAQLRDFALRQGIKAVSANGYKPTHFFQEKRR